MTQQVYSRDILQNFSRTQLWEACDKLCIAHRRSKKDCINDILAKQPQLVAPAELEEAQQPANLPAIGDVHFIDNFLLKCVKVGGEYAVVWDVCDGNNRLGEISMGWDCFWVHALSFTKFATPQEAVANLYESLQEYKQEQMKKDYGYQVTITGWCGVCNFRWLQTKEQVLANLRMDFSANQIEGAVITPLPDEVIVQLEKEHEEAWDRY
ncbi:hypothetical protein [Aulosira sp. FACHB-615]|uniref:hypothetical protein n=1 Tax=Aulosira sp. FACHB-615 TaxID=2692777 RepID=UPI00168634B9|nr:hypothetical protein [Aulosira sp. FACHB-615]MBD2488976.1 hypothetical protein [Aulosira sp. FACHB-615]